MEATRFINLASGLDADMEKAPIWFMSAREI